MGVCARDVADTVVRRVRGSLSNRTEKWITQDIFVTGNSAAERKVMRVQLI